MIFQDKLRWYGTAQMQVDGLVWVFTLAFEYSRTNTHVEKVSAWHKHNTTPYVMSLNRRAESFTNWNSHEHFYKMLKNFIQFTPSVSTCTRKCFAHINQLASERINWEDITLMYAEAERLREYISWVHMLQLLCNILISLVMATVGWMSQVIFTLIYETVS